MESDIFKAGVAPGSPTSQHEIKLLLCYILSKLGKAMSFSQLHELLTETSLVNYFDLVAAVDSLLQTGHLDLRSGEGEGECYSLTQIGREAAQELTASLPLAVREKAVATANRIHKQQQRLEELDFRAEPQPQGGYLLLMSIPSDENSGESGPHLASFSLFVPSAAERDLVRRRFLNDPLFLYKGVLSLLTGNREVLEELLPGQETLFD